jgi:hypothetical protein
VQLVLDEHGFGHHGTGAAGTGPSGERRQQMQKKNGQIAHRTILPTSQHRELLRNSAIRHAHLQSRLATVLETRSVLLGVSRCRRAAIDISHRVIEAVRDRLAPTTFHVNSSGEATCTPGC